MILQKEEKPHPSLRVHKEEFPPNERIVHFCKISGGKRRIERDTDR